jgi:hypothetical protein
VDGFNDDDRLRSIENVSRLDAMSDRLDSLARSQQVSLRRLRRLPDLTATAIVAAVSKRALIFLGIGIALGSALGGAGVELARKLVAIALGVK